MSIYKTLISNKAMVYSSQQAIDALKNEAHRFIIIYKCLYALNRCTFQIQVFRGHINFVIPYHGVVHHMRLHEQADGF